MTSPEDSNISYVKYKQEYKEAKRIVDGGTIRYKLTNPVNEKDATIILVNSINKKDEIAAVNLNKFKGALDLCKRNKYEIEYVYDTLIIEYKFTIQALKKIINKHVISNYRELYSLRNIIKSPFDLINEESSLITYEKAEKIADDYDLEVPFEVLVVKWSYHAIRSMNMGYVPTEKFWEQFREFCLKKKIDMNKYRNIIESACVLVENKKYITTNYYLNLEKSMGDRVMDLVQTECKQFEVSRIREMIETYEEDNSITLNEQQKIAVINGINENFSIVIGYPGTGKTTITHCILWIYQKLRLDTRHAINTDDFYDHTDNEYSDNDSIDNDFNNNQKYYSGISVLAPTGRAYLNIFNKLKFFNLDPDLSGTIHKSIHSSFHYISQTQNTLDEWINIIVSKENIDRSFVKKYLYSALTDRERIFVGGSKDERDYKKMKAFVKDDAIRSKKERFLNKKDYLTKNVSFMVVDEVSMVNNFTFSELLNWATVFECKMLILGDENQLPSVEDGAVLEKMIQSGVIPLTKLTEIKRQDDVDGKLIKVIKKMATRKLVSTQEFDNKSICFEDMNKYINKDKTYNVDKIYKDLIEKHGVNMDNSKTLSYFNSNKFDFCTPVMNKMLQKKYVHSDSIEIPKPPMFYLDKDLILFRVGDRIVRKANDYTEGVLHANGEEAIIINYNKDTFDATIKYESMEKNTVISIEDLYNEFVLGYAITIHKSQGSQYDIVVFFLQTKWEKMNTRIVYTGVSRAIKKCIIVTTPEIFKQIQLNPPEKRISYFMEKFNEYDVLLE
jgi:hypothetical protein